ncbi:aminotransferase class IV [Cryobacterium frigoriphilum]|uniref:aminotransferase class IV n=1 Tax=Cryobacterium frigoriphilum TaxID=1259150 RepID=UPI001F546AB1|nr:aminotransferase class IV [Cryobacterium frigoriphilum]
MRRRCVTGERLAGLQGRRCAGCDALKYCFSTADVSLTCFITSTPGEFEAPEADAQLTVLTRTTAPAMAPEGPIALDVVAHQRDLPHIKHVGEVGKTLALRRARTRGFTDAAFHDPQGRLSEGTIWNLAFWDGNTVNWPDADILPGATMQILQRQLSVLGVVQTTRPIRHGASLGQLAGVVMNPWTPGIAVTRIGESQLATDDDFTRLLHSAYERERLEPI